MISASLDPVPPLTVADRLRPRPQMPIAVLFTALIGTMTLLIAAASFATRSPVVSVISLGLGAFGLYATVGGYLWADAERVGMNRLFGWTSCRREELVYLSIYSGGAGRAVRCSFVRKDGTVAFTAAAMVFGTRRLGLFARSLGVPSYGPGEPPGFPR